MRSLLYALTVLSLPLRGAWIEIMMGLASAKMSQRRSPCGERGLKFMYGLPPENLFAAPPAGSVD